MGMNSLDLSRQYTSFSGVDIRVVVAGETVGNLQALSYAVQREKAPIYVMGRVDPLSFSRGKRGIAGTLISLMLDQHLIFNQPFGDMNLVVDNDEIYPAIDTFEERNNATDTEDLNFVGSPQFQEGNLGSNYLVRNAWYVDQIPPFDAVIVAANEYGQAATMRIYGIEILNEGSGFSIDDIVIENQMTYVCRTILPWQKLGQWDLTTPNGQFTAPRRETTTV
jgi:hypothetical protein